MNKNAVIVHHLQIHIYIVAINATNNQVIRQKKRGWLTL